MSLRALITSGTKVWLDSVDPAKVEETYLLGVTGATSNPIIIADILKTGAYDEGIVSMLDRGLDDETIAWEMTDRLVREAQQVFYPVWQQTVGNNGFVSFELDPLLEDAASPLSRPQRTQRYIELGRKWSAGHHNRMIKVPATPAGLDALEELAAGGVTLNVTLCFTQRQYIAARDAIWRGAQRLPSLENFKSVYSIFVSRVDVYTQKHVPQLSSEAQGQVGIVNARRMWRMNREFWRDKPLRLQQEIVFASTGVKNPGDPPDKYVGALAGGDIQTDPPATIEAVENLQKSYPPRLLEMPPANVLEEIDREVDQEKMEEILMEEGAKKFSEPMKALLATIAEKRTNLGAARKRAG